MKEKTTLNTICSLYAPVGRTDTEPLHDTDNIIPSLDVKLYSFIHSVLKSSLLDVDQNHFLVIKLIYANNDVCFNSDQLIGLLNEQCNEVVHKHPNSGTLGCPFSTYTNNN